MTERYDLVILGSGSAAFAAALTAQELAKTAVMTEARHPRYPGLTGGAMALDGRALIAQKDALIHAYRAQRYERLLGDRIHLAMGPVAFVDAHTVEVGGRRLVGDKLLIATGRRPHTDTIAIERAGVSVNAEGEVEVDEFLRTNVPHIFAAGDVIGRQVQSQMATPVGSRDGRIAALNALSGEPPRRVDHRVMPRVIFTDPQAAAVGLTEAAAVQAGHRCWCNTLPMSLVPRAGAIRKTHGFVKMVADAESHEVLGVAMVGDSAGEVIHEAAMALHFRARLQDFIELIHVYPTMAEALKLVAISRFKDPGRLSCCAE